MITTHHCEDCQFFHCYGYQHYGCDINCTDDMDDPTYIDNVAPASPLSPICNNFKQH